MRVVCFCLIFEMNLVRAFCRKFLFENCDGAKTFLRDHYEQPFKTANLDNNEILQIKQCSRGKVRGDARNFWNSLGVFLRTYLILLKYYPVLFG